MAINTTFLNLNYTFTNNDTAESITFSDETDYVANGKLVILQSMPTGMHDVELRQFSENLSGRDGIRTGDIFLGRKGITFDSLLVADSVTLMNDLINDMRQVFIPVLGTGINKTLHRLTFTDIDSIPKYIDYQVSDVPSFEKVINEQLQLHCIFSILCEDPRYFSVTATTETLNLVQISGGLQVPAQIPAQLSTAQVGGEDLNNAGNFRTQPTTIIRGPVTNPILTNVTTGKSLKYTVTLVAGENITTNHATGATTKNGSDNSDELTNDSQFLELYPGDNYFVFTDDTLNATGECSITFNSAWL